MMEGYVSFAAVEGLGLPPDGVDDDEKDGDDEKNARDEWKRGKGIIGTWARKLFVGIGSSSTNGGGGNGGANPNPTTTTVS